MSAVWSIDLPDSQKIVLLALADSANDEGHCWPGMKSLVAKTSKTDRTIQAMIKELCDAGHLTRREVPGKGCNYTVHPRTDFAPKPVHPRSDCATPPKPVRDTPETVSGKPSKNHQEPPLVKSSASDDQPLTIEEVVEDWNAMAVQVDLPVCRKITLARRRAFKARQREYPDMADWQRAFMCIRNTPWMHGENDRGWKADIDFLLQAKSFTKLSEEAYGQAKRRVA